MTVSFVSLCDPFTILRVYFLVLAMDSYIFVTLMSHDENESPNTAQETADVLVPPFPPPMRPSLISVVPLISSGGDSEEQWEQVLRERREEQLDEVMKNVGCWDKFMAACCCCCNGISTNRTIMKTYQSLANSKAKQVRDSVLIIVNLTPVFMQPISEFVLVALLP